MEEALHASRLKPRTQRVLRSGLITLIGLCAGAASADDPPWVARATRGMVASDSREASQIGADVLNVGGNAFDAAVATSFALGVARPQSTGMGGGGFLLAYVAHDESFVVLDFRETAPAAATLERYAALEQKRGDGPSPTLRGGNAIAVPGLVAGLAEINRRFGTRPWAELVTPAARLAQRGAIVDECLLEARQELLKDATRWPELTKQYPHVFDWLSPEGRAPQLGAPLRNTGLARGLRLLAEMGPRAFYDGPIAEAVVRSAAAAGGGLTMEDLRAYEPKYRDPQRFAFGDCEIVVMPPPSSGGVCLAEILQTIEVARARADVQAAASQPAERRSDALGAHVMVEAMKHAFADRARWLGDADFAEVPVRRLMSRDHAAALAGRIALGRTLPLEAYGSPTGGGSTSLPVDDGGTSHFCVADRWGNLVALTETINENFGSLVVAEPFGILLNDEIDDFLIAPGRQNTYGLVQGEANLIAAGKRPLSSMSPTIVLKNGKPVLVVGAAGGPRIITAVAQVLLRVIDGAPLEEAMAAPRLHHQWRPDTIFWNAEPPSELRAALEKLGHKVSDERRYGVVNAIQITADGTLVGASDAWRCGRPVGLTPGKPAR